MAADSRDWSSNANDALQVRLRHQDKSKDVHFQPMFTYPIFGDEESIFGYRGLKIRLDYTADTLKPSLAISSSHKYDAVGDTKPDDIQAALAQFLPSLPSDAAPDQPASTLPVAQDEDWTPPGELMHQYEVKGRSYGIWSATLTDTRAKELLRDMQIFVLFFIEGGTCIDLDDPDWTMDRWRVFFLYAIDSSPAAPQKSTYSFVGYATAYTLFFIDKAALTFTTNETVPDAVPTADTTALQFALPCRSRISQFLVLPPHQSAGHGAHLYDTIIVHFLGQPTTHEITVEDPNESFDDLRDYSDLARLRTSDPAFPSLTLNTNVTLPGAKSSPLPTDTLLARAELAAIRARAKIAPRQFARLAEMQLLSRIPPKNRHLARLTRKDRATDHNDRMYYFWRLLVKQRIYQQNADTLAQLERDERVEKLEETLVGLEKDYLRILDGAERRAARLAEDVVAAADRNGGVVAAGAANGAAPLATAAAVGPRLAKKRKVVDEDEDDEDDEDEAGSEVNGTLGGKRRKVSVA